MANILAIFLLALEGPVLLLALQRFDKQPEYTEVNPGDDALLVCKVYDMKGQCSWQKDGKPVGLYRNKYEWSVAEQRHGDCSLRVKNATLDFDDGEWECQVTASSFQSQDALTSAPVRLVVRVKPQHPRIEYNTSQIPSGQNVTAREGDRAAVKCVSRYGNPPARLKWLIGDEEIVSRSNQTNSSELDRPKTWVATSVLELTFSKDKHGKHLRCVALHDSYPTKAQAIEVGLDVQYAPIVTLLGAPSQDLEENVHSVRLRCLADANPPAEVLWRRDGDNTFYSSKDEIIFKPVHRNFSGTYTCHAQNLVGISDMLSVKLDVKYPPSIKHLGPDRVNTVNLFQQITFQCSAEGNPPPTYQWLQKLPTVEETVYIRGTEPNLFIRNVTYDYQGEYVCKATNWIGGIERLVQSDAISLEVVGAPQVLRHSASREVIVARGEDAVLRLVVCADPKPNRVAWEWGSLQLEAGDGQGKYEAEELRQDPREDCYEAKLHVKAVDPSDSRNYYLSVENGKGIDRHAIHLAVKDPVSMATVMSIVAGCLVLLVIVVLLILYAFRREKWCFARRGDFRPSDLESEKSDADSQGRKTPKLENTGGGLGSIPAEAIYTTSPKRPASPEAMKQMKEYGIRGRPHGHSDVLYADLQVPKASNNGSMKNNRTQKTNMSRTEYATIQFQPKSLERAEI